MQLKKLLFFYFLIKLASNTTRINETSSSLSSAVLGSVMISMKSMRVKATTTTTTTSENSEERDEIENKNRFSNKNKPATTTTTTTTTTSVDYDDEQQKKTTKLFDISNSLKSSESNLKLVDKVSKFYSLSLVCKNDSNNNNQNKTTLIEIKL